MSGKTDLTYFQALASEAEDTTQVHRSFPEPLKGPILRAVQFREFVLDSIRREMIPGRLMFGVGVYAEMDGRLDDMVDKIADRLKDRFFVNESEWTTSSKWYFRETSILT